MADIPGLIEGASQGVGLGHDFLKHIERAGILIHLVEPMPMDQTDPIENYTSIRHELEEYNAQLKDRPEIVVVTKSELPDAADVAEMLATETGKEVHLISAVTRCWFAKIDESNCSRFGATHSMQLIAVDIGNSSTKIAVDHMGDDDRWSSTTIVRDDNGLDELKKNVLGDSFSCCWVVCSVNKVRQNRLARWVQSNRPDDQFHIISADDVPLKTAVESREQLGRDRLLAAWMATNLDDESGPLIVIDAGTAVTIDYVDAAEVFQGGVIYPGADSNFPPASSTPPMHFLI